MVHWRQSLFAFDAFFPFPYECVTTIPVAHPESSWNLFALCPVLWAYLSSAISACLFYFSAKSSYSGQLSWVCLTDLSCMGWCFSSGTQKTVFWAVLCTTLAGRGGNEQRQNRLLWAVTPRMPRHYRSWTLPRVFWELQSKQSNIFNLCWYAVVEDAQQLMNTVWFKIIRLIARILDNSNYTEFN